MVGLKSSRLLFLCALMSALMALISCSRIQARINADKGYRAYLNKAFAESIQNYEAAIQLTPDDKTIMRNLGYAYLGAARETQDKTQVQTYYKQAIKYLSQLMVLEPKDKELSGVLLEAWTQADKLDEAALFFSERVNKDPNDVESIRLLGMIELRRGNYQAALDAYEKRQKLMPNDVQLYASKATLCWEWLRSGGPVDKAIALSVASAGLDAALEADKRDPSHPSALVYAGLLLRERATRQTEPLAAAKDLMSAQKYLEQIRARKQANESGRAKQISKLESKTPK